MLAFKMKRPLQNMQLSKSLAPKLDTERWPDAKGHMDSLTGFRDKVREASLSYSEKGAQQCREVFGRYNVLVYQASFICQNINLGDSKLAFRWSDAFDDSAYSEVADWGFERACVTFNLAASISFLATHQDRGADAGSKAACGLFQQAAGVLAAVQVLLKEGAWRCSADLSADTIGCLETLMLAQGQKCFYEKAARDKMKPAIVSKLAAEAAALYESVSLRIAEAHGRSRPISAMGSDWLDVIEWNRLLFDGLQQYHLSEVHLEAHEYGNQVSRLTYATNKCADAVNACRSGAPALQKQFTDAYNMCLAAHTKAKHDNDMIYTEKVPAATSLPKPARQAMVKSVAPKELTELASATPTPVEPAPPAVSREPSEDNEGLRAQLGELTAVVKQLSENQAPPVGAPVGGDAAPPPFAAAEAAAVTELLSMGFEREKAEAALAQSNGSVQAATELLLNGGGGVAHC